MDLYLQMGHGMKTHAIELIKTWGDGTVILSPKNMALDQMKSTAKEILESNGSVMVDPQFYVPRTSQEKLNTHSFWPNNFNTNLFFNQNGINEMIEILLNEYNYSMNASGFIMPTLLLESINDDWDRTTDIIINSVENCNIQVPKFLTLCIGEEILKNEGNTHLLIERLENFPVDGYYIIPIHPNNSYLIDNPNWLLNLLDLCASIKLLNKKVILGYSNHQFLLLSLAKIDAICAGVWIKTRSFPLNDFNERDERQRGGNRNIWYYCPQALSEYQIDYLDVANRVGILNELRTPDTYDSAYVNILFQGTQPSTVNFLEKEAFRHYLCCLKQQCHEVSKDSYGETRMYLRTLFTAALDLTNHFRTHGVMANYRDFNTVGEINLSLLDAFDNIRGLIYESKWQEI